MAFTTPRMILGGLVLAALTISGCTEECTTVGCVDSITVTFDRAVARDYKVEITFNDQKGSADCTLKTHPEAGEVEVPVLGLDGVNIACRENGALLQGAPDHVAFVFQFAVGSAANVDLKPKYEDVTPNGPECDPTCDQAEVDVALPPAS